MVQSLHNIKEDSIIFNREVFGNIFASKKRLEARLKGVQRKLESIDSTRLVYLQKELLQDYENILFREEAFWFQKSREQWIKLGSRNTAFFHAQTVIRRKRNKIHGLFLPSSTWCTDPSILQEEAVRYFQKLFDADGAVGGECEDLSIPTLPSEAKHNLMQPVSKEEVYQALMGMKSYKAPGPDGFQPIFYKMFWSRVGDDVWQFVKNAFASGSFDPCVTETLLVLIPKGDHPTTFKGFRPISLCNVLYKLITKVLVNRLRLFLHDLISPNQSSFIHERGTTDNAIVLQEIIHHMHTSKKKKRGCSFQTRPRKSI